MRIFYFVMGSLVSFILTLYLYGSYNDTEQRMYYIAKNSYLAGCFRKEADCVKASNDYERNLKSFLHTITSISKR